MIARVCLPYLSLVALLVWMVPFAVGWEPIGNTARWDNLAVDDPCREDQRCPWLYLREGEPVQEDEDLVQIVAVGDIQTGRQVSLNSKTFELVTAWVQAADLAIGNFEGVIAQPGMDAIALSSTKPGEPYRLVSPAGAEKYIQQAGFDILGLANNHALDLDQSGIRNTITRLKQVGLQIFGVVDPDSSMLDPLIFDYKGLRIGLIGYTVIQPQNMITSGLLPALYDPLQQAVRQARLQADVVIVSIHWGFEYQLKPDPQQVQIARSLFAAGADIVLGHHPHVVQGTMVLDGSEDKFSVRDHFVAYSLGNFVFDQYAGETQYGLALRLFVDKDGLRAIQALPLRATTRPGLLDEDESAALRARIVPEPKKLRFSCQTQECTVSDDELVAKSGIFRNGQIDLTGDGVPEQVELRNGKIDIYEDQTLVWTSPAEWQVLDVDLGDPNRDGRFEIMLSVRKPDKDRFLRSHPFIVGFRDGMYKLIWGGSALSTPISEVALGDVDGDQNQELIVLEELPERGGSMVSVWRWHGWGFSLVWRSQGDAFRNLVLVNHHQDSGVDIQVEKTWGGLD